MKKQMLLLGAILCMALSSKAIMIVTVTSASGSGGGLDCTVSAPYWPSTNVCCCDINCNNANGTYAGFIMSCIRFTGFIVSPPPATPTRFDVEADISLSGAVPFSPAQVDYYNAFKKDGSYTLKFDTSYTDADGNKVIYKAGTYKITNNKIAILASSQKI